MPSMDGLEKKDDNTDEESEPVLTKPLPKSSKKIKSKGKSPPKQKKGSL